MAAAALSLALIGCSDKPKGPPVSQMAAKVNGELILRQQVEDATTTTTSATTAARDQAAGETLDRMIDTTLLVQAAKAKGLDKTPAVERRMEQARQQALATAYLEQVALANLPTLGTVHAEQYFADNPLLFAQRRVYVYRELRLEWPLAAAGQLRRDLEAARSAAEVDRLLGQRRATARERQMQEPAERVPLLALRQIAALTPGRTLVLAESVPNAQPPTERARVITLVSSRPAPLAFNEAQDSILAYLRSKQRAEALAVHLAELRNGAKVERYALERRADPLLDKLTPTR